MRTHALTFDIVRHKTDRRAEAGALMVITGIVHMKISSLSDVDEFISSSDLEKCSIASLVHQWMLSSEWVPSE